MSPTRSVSFSEDVGGGDKNASARSNLKPAPPAPLTVAPTTSTTTDNDKTLQCPNCGAFEIEHDNASGASVCVKCGVVVEENAIVSSVEFVEGAGGSSNMVGQFVSAHASKAYNSNAAHNRRYGFSRDSRETTLANGRRRIQEVASRLRLNTNYVDAAHRLFTMAVEKNFVQGRRTTHVVAACLYIACRQEKSQHMLIDFSDALQVNVYTLGTCFLKFRRLLGLKLEIIDPALYVYRFAAHLELDDKANAVAMTALRLVGRMKRDWIVAGRRPAGICAAALLIASRAHGFGRHHSDVTSILKVCGWTVHTRVREFEATASSALTLAQFGHVDLAGEADPPVYTRNKLNEARARAIQDGNVALLESGALDDPHATTAQKAAKWRHTTNGKRRKKVKFAAMYSDLQQELNLHEEDEDDADSLNNGEDVIEANDAGEASSEDATSTDPKKHAETQIVPATDSAADALSEYYPVSRLHKPLMLPNLALPEELQLSQTPSEGQISLVDWKDSMPATLEDEFDDLFRNEDEAKQREAIFNKINKEYLEQQARKESERKSAEAALHDKEKDDLTQVQGHARYKRNKRQRNNATTADDEAVGEEEQPLTTEEQLRAVVASRKISRKINYEALSSIFDDDGSFATTDGGGGGANTSVADDDMFGMI